MKSVRQCAQEGVTETEEEREGIERRERVRRGKRERKKKRGGRDRGRTGRSGSTAHYITHACKPVVHHVRTRGLIDCLLAVHTSVPWTTPTVASYEGSPIQAVWAVTRSGRACSIRRCGRYRRVCGSSKWGWGWWEWQCDAIDRQVNKIYS